MNNGLKQREGTHSVCPVDVAMLQLLSGQEGKLQTSSANCIKGVRYTYWLWQAGVR